MMYNVDFISKVALKYLDEAENSYRNGNFIAAIILYGASLEASLLSMCFCYQRKARHAIKKLGLQQKLKKRLEKRGRKRGILYELDYSDLILVANKLQWICLDDIVDDQNKLKDYIYLVRESRNLIHPIRWLKPDPYFNELHKFIQIASTDDLKKLCELLKEIVHSVNDLLVFNIVRDLEKKIGPLE